MLGTVVVGVPEGSYWCFGGTLGEYMDSPPQHFCDHCRDLLAAPAQFTNPFQSVSLLSLVGLEGIFKVFQYFPNSINDCPVMTANILYLLFVLFTCQGQSVCVGHIDITI